MSDAVAFLLILPAMVLAMVVLDAAGTLGIARHRSATFVEMAAVQSAEVLSRSATAAGPASSRSRWAEASAATEQAGRAATAGVCNQTDSNFGVSLVSHEPNAGSFEVAAVVSCPVELGRLWLNNRVVTASVAPLK
ncbi:MAG: hypothetical protein OXE93_09020 [bacterium]|nr:hypothetical protein [bacterium]